jgi:hypothetical protein
MESKLSFEKMTGVTADGKRCALIAGAGAVAGAWTPVLRALQRFVDFPLTVDGGNSFLARAVYLARWFSSPFYDSQPHSQYRDAALKGLRDVKQAIASELISAEMAGEITHRASLEHILKRMMLPFSASMLFVTTNWDTIVPKAISEIMRPDWDFTFQPLHIHGTAADPSTLYLPSEVTQERYRQPDEDQKIGTMHGRVWKNLEVANRVTLYGLAIDPLDAELGQTLAAGWSNSNLEEVFIVNPHHSVVAHRVNLLDNRRDVRMIRLNTETLEVEEDYTIWRHGNQ